MKSDNTNTLKKERSQATKRTPAFYGVSGCALGFLIMVVFATIAIFAGISGRTYATIMNVGSWVLPIGLGVLGYFYGKSKQSAMFRETKEQK